MADRELLVRILGDDRQLQQTFANTNRTTAQLEKRTQGIGVGLGRAFAAAGVVIGAHELVRGINSSVEAASNLNEQISKSRQIFGSSSAGVEGWAETTANSIGIANDAALEATGTFGNLFSTVGLDQRRSAQMSQALVTLAADLASFNNASPTDTLDAIRSGLIGEAEPLRRYGVLLSETRVQQRAMAETGKTNAKALTDQEKALARYEIIMQDTSKAQGDFARTSGGLANQQRILAANVRDASAQIGQKLLPVLGAATKAANAFLGSGGQIDFQLNVEGLRELEDARAQIQGMTDDAGLLGVALDAAIEKLSRTLTPGTVGPPGGGGEGGLPAAIAAIQAANAARDRRAENAAQRRRRDRFAASLSGLGLKLQKAELTKPLDNDIAVLNEIIARIKREEKVEGRTFALESALVQAEGQLAQKVAEQRANAASATAAAQQRADDAEKRADDAADRARERRRRRRQAQVEARRRALAETQGDQFAALGLTRAGAERIPGVAALRRRGTRLSTLIKGTALDTPQTRGELARIRRVLSGEFGKVGDDVRAAILAMFDKIAGGLQQGSKTTAKATTTAFRVANTSEVLGGLGLDVEQTQRLRRRLSRLGPGFTTPAPGGPGGAFGFSTNDGVVINGNVTVIAKDPEDFGRKLEKKGRRTTTSRSGPHAGRKLGGV